LNGTRGSWLLSTTTANVLERYTVARLAEDFRELYNGCLG